ncbi:MAG: hypothetical protein KKG99_07175 [Bacteroidetes bacterium]|nr:hypothetical protein [Bacteroidota bacterium]
MKIKNGVMMMLFMQIGMLSNLAFAQSSNKLNSSLRSETIENLSKMLADFYVYPENGKKMADLLKTNLHNGKYDQIDNFDQFGSTLTRDLFEAAKDIHLRIYYDPTGVENIRNDKAVSETEKENDLLKQKKDFSKTNFGFNHLEILPGNIGYLKLTYMERVDWSGETATNAMNFLSNADYIIIDLRDNAGGNIEMIPFLASYFYNSIDDVLIFETQIPSENEVIQYRTLPYLPGKRMAKTPLYILIGRNTISAGESLAYTLQKLGRATVVGEKTVYAGAHILRYSKIVNDYYLVRIPEMLCVNPITKTDWEGVGVEPDIKTESKDALDKTIEIINDKLIEENNDERFINGLGYSLLADNQIASAIKVFIKNTNLYPQSANTFDSLAEAYMKFGQNDLAIKNYKKSLELNPNNENAKKMLEDLMKK